MNSKFHIWFGKDLVQVGSCCDEDIGDLAFDCDKAANAIFERRKIPLHIYIHIGGARVDHGIALEDGHLLHLKEFVFDRCLQNSEIERLARTQLARVELPQSIVKPP